MKGVSFVFGGRYTETAKEFSKSGSRPAWLNPISIAAVALRVYLVTDALAHFDDHERGAVRQDTQFGA